MSQVSQGMGFSCSVLGAASSHLCAAAQHYPFLPWLRHACGVVVRQLEVVVKACNVLAFPLPAASKSIQLVCVNGRGEVDLSSILLLLFWTQSCRKNKLMTKRMKFQLESMSMSADRYSPPSLVCRTDTQSVQSQLPGTYFQLKY